MARILEEPAGYKAPAVQKTIQILKALSGSASGMGVSELSRKLGFSKSTTFGLTQALVKEGVLTQGPEGKRFFLGATIFELALADWNFLKTASQAQPVLDDLRSQIRETVCLGVMNQGKVLIIATAEAENPLRISTPVGAAIPLLAGAVGKALLSHLPERQVNGLISELGFRPFTANSIVIADQYTRELDRSRRQGYGVDDEEYIKGVRAVAVSLRNTKGLPMAIWAVGLASSIQKKDMPVIATQLMQTAIRLKKPMEIQ